MSLAGPSSPRATLPKSLTLRAPSFISARSSCSLLRSTDARNRDLSAAGRTANSKSKPAAPTIFFSISTLGSRLAVADLEEVRNDRLGTLRKITIVLPQRWKGKEPGPFATSSPPPELDYDQWLGQAPDVGYCSERVHGLFRRWFEYAGGTLTDWGAHHMDIPHWAMDMDASGQSLH